MTIPAGLSAFPITPTASNGDLDEIGLKRLVARLVEVRVDSIGLLGSTGTYIYLTRQERRRALEVAVGEAGGRTPILVGIGALRTDDAVKLAQDAKAIGAVAGLLAPVSYIPLTDDEVFGHFVTVAHESSLPIVIYDNPGTTHFRFTPELVGRLAKVPGIVGIKNPGGGSEETARHLAEQRTLVPGSFSIGYSGDWYAAEAMIAGADVWHSVLGGLFPRPCQQIVKAARQGNADEARRVDASLAPVWNLFKQFSSLRVVYALADMMDICRGEPPRPILPLPGAARHQVAEMLKDLPSEITG
ncbi:dihydrodipicolinate synthase family protein [Mesorhizobium caraganae]|uniref:dihydrodipicolinate synthase family protein n=1 Tax=Mesorhizobium caraganae TaxID=483206 RepID=UPI001780865C|nr:dihydrodipicolinate synthase family protein [Mesorhizobium caraganae]MBM2712893.1 dihydrodipicolinate synthase family protein [Mesorhizobium caraganae]